MLMAADDRKITLLSLLDMSAAFDCVDHPILLQRLQVAAGIASTALDWIRSFLSGRTQRVTYDGEQSVTSAVLFGVPQGTVLGPLLYVLYTAPLFSIFAKHQIDAHQYADDLQLYLCVSPAEASVAADRLGECLVDVEVWLRASRLRLNPGKTHVMWLGSAQQLAKVRPQDIRVLTSQIKVVDAAKNLGVVIDSQLSMSAQVAAVCRNSYYQLRQLRPLRRCMTDEAITTLTHAFISSRLDYCNALYYGITDGLLGRLQSVQNAAARLVTGARRCDHITPVLRQLHWLPVRQRVQFKLATLVYRALAGTAPAYLSSECHLTSSVRGRSLRSADSRTCLPRRAHNGFGDRCFATAGPTLWNSLPQQLRQPNVSFDRFKALLKTFLFR
jgi:hypothetical protein